MGRLLIKAMSPQVATANSWQARRKQTNHDSHTKRSSLRSSLSNQHGLHPNRYKNRHSATAGGKNPVAEKINDSSPQTWHGTC